MYLMSNNRLGTLGSIAIVEAFKNVYNTETCKII